MCLLSLTATFVLCGLNAQKPYNLVNKTKRDIKILRPFITVVRHAKY